MAQNAIQHARTTSPQYPSYCSLEPPPLPLRGLLPPSLFPALHHYTRRYGYRAPHHAAPPSHSPVARSIVASPIRFLACAFSIQVSRTLIEEWRILIKPRDLSINECRTLIEVWRILIDTRDLSIEACDHSIKEWRILIEACDHSIKERRILIEGCGHSIKERRILIRACDHSIKERPISIDTRKTGPPTIIFPNPLYPYGHAGCSGRGYRK